MNSIQVKTATVQGAVNSANNPIRFLDLEFVENRTNNDFTQPKQADDDFIQVSKSQLESIYLTIKRQAIGLSSIESVSELSIEYVDQLNFALYNAQNNLHSMLEGKEIAR